MRMEFRRWALAAGAGAVALVAPFGVQAKIIAHDVEIVLDQVGPGQQFKVGDVHKARIFYDDANLNQKTKRIQMLHMQHLRTLVPKHLDPVEMPMGNSMVDLSGPVIRFHYAAVPPPGPGMPEASIAFDEVAQRMTIRKVSDGGLVITGKYTVKPQQITGPEIDAAVTPQPLVGLEMITTLSYVDPTAPSPFKVGDEDRVRLVYDPAKVDPVTKKVRPYGSYHFIGGRFADSIPTDDMVLDLSAQPYKLVSSARVRHGQLIEVTATAAGVNKVVDLETGKTMTEGPYRIDPAPIPMNAATAPQPLPPPRRAGPAGPGGPPPA